MKLFWIALMCIALPVIATSCSSARAYDPPTAAMQVQHSSTAKNGRLIYVANSIVRNRRWFGSSLLGFASDAHGNVAPIVEISGMHARIGLIDTSAAVDKSGRLYISGPYLNSIAVFPAGSSGDVKFAAYFDVGCDSFSPEPIVFVLDGTGDVWAACYEGSDAAQRGIERSSIFEFPPVPAEATGHIKLTPIREITGPKTGLNRISSIALNGKGQVSVGDARHRGVSVIHTFDVTANGNVAPLSTLGGNQTLLGTDWDTGGGYGGLRYDSHGRLVACSGGRKPGLLTFAQGARGNAEPISDLFVPGCFGIALDAADNIYVSFNNSILVYAAGSVGPAKPVRTIRGKLTTLDRASSVTF